MLIKLIIISVMILPNGLPKKTIEEVWGYPSIQACLSDKDLVVEAYSKTEVQKLIAVNCIQTGET